jgi:hypothetical protein
LVSTATTRIAIAKERYDNFMEILPEELNDTTVQALDSAKVLLNQITGKDTGSLKRLLAEHGLTISLEEFESPIYTIRKAFPLRDELLTRNSEIIKCFLGQWTASKEVLLYLADKIIEVLPAVRRLFTEFNSSSSSSSSPAQQRERRIAFIDLTRYYQEFRGYAVNIHEIIEDYEEVFSFLSKRIADQTYSFEDHVKRCTSTIFHFELFKAIEELLLHGNFGRFTPTPLIRSVLEIMITRGILNTEYSSKYRGRQIEPERNFRLDDILDAVQNTNYEFTIGTDSIRRLYDWGSISVHRGSRMRHSQMWYALVVIGQIRNGLIVAKPHEVSKVWDDILDELIREGVIRIV